MLHDHGIKTVVFERENFQGGLIHCSFYQKNLFHEVGGHVFNSKNQRVMRWFSKYFNLSEEFSKAKRNASIYMEDQFVRYPIELNLKDLPRDIATDAINDLIELANKETRILR